MVAGSLNGGAAFSEVSTGKPIRTHDSRPAKFFLRSSLFALYCSASVHINFAFGLNACFAFAGTLQLLLLFV